MTTETPPKDTRLIREITLRNILSFGPDTPPFELRPLNVLIGANGSGKSNLIDCIALMRSTPKDFLKAVRDVGGSSDLAWKGIKQNGTIPLSMKFDMMRGYNNNVVSHQFDFTVTKNDTPKPYQEFINLWIENIGPNIITEIYSHEPSHLTTFIKAISLEGETEEIEIDPPRGYSILNEIRDYNRHFWPTSLSDAYESIRIYRSWNYVNLRDFQPADLRQDILLEDMSNLKLFLGKFLIDSDLRRELVKALGNLFDGIKDVKQLPVFGQVQIYLEEENNSHPATRLSNGTLNYISLLAILLDPDPPALICIEEPELGLHPDVLPGLADLLIEASTRTQLIVTTHSEILVDALNDTPESVVVCEKHNGQTVMERLDEKRLKPYLEKWRLGELWISGEIGGKRW